MTAMNGLAPSGMKVWVCFQCRSIYSTSNGRRFRVTTESSVCSSEMNFAGFEMTPL